MTTSHGVMRAWRRSAGRTPVTVAATKHDGHPGVLRLECGSAPGREADESRSEAAQDGSPPQDGLGLLGISWDDWFADFDSRGPNFSYQEQASHGRTSDFLRLENPDHEEG